MVVPVKDLGLVAEEREADGQGAVQEEEQRCLDPIRVTLEHSGREEEAVEESYATNFDETESKLGRNWDRE